MSEKRLKIALFCDSFFPLMDGVAMVIDNYAKILSKKHDVTVFVPSGREDFDDSKLPYKVVRCKKKLKVFFLDYDLPLPQLDKNFKREALESKFDIVHLHSPVSIAKFGLKVAKKQKIPAVFHAHSQFKQDIYRSTKSHILSSLVLKSLMKVVNGCDECWAVNKRVAGLFKEYGAKIPMKVQENGTEIKPLTENREEKIREIRNEYGLNDGQKLLLFVGRLNILKNILFLCDALKQLKSDTGGGIFQDVVRRHWARRTKTEKTHQEKQFARRSDSHRQNLRQRKTQSNLCCSGSLLLSKLV